MKRGNNTYKKQTILKSRQNSEHFDIKQARNIRICQYPEKTLKTLKSAGCLNQRNSEFK